jgi:hypothetical protein
MEQLRKESVNNAKVNEKLEALITLFTTPFDVHSVKERSFWYIMHHNLRQISSLDEYKIIKLAQTNTRPLGDFHRFYFSRIYPSGQRVQSSNYESMLSFMQGVSSSFDLC